MPLAYPLHSENPASQIVAISISWRDYITYSRHLLNLYGANKPLNHANWRLSNIGIQIAQLRRPLDIENCMLRANPNLNFGLARNLLFCNDV